MPVASTVISPSNIPTPLSIGNDQGTVLGISATDKIAFFGGTPVVQQTPAGYATLQTAGSTTALYVNSATTGGVGTTQYTFGDIVAVLKALNLLAN
jgi:hypothetical protein